MEHRELKTVLVKEISVSGRAGFSAVFLKPDGTHHQHIMPVHTLAAWSVEQGIPLSTNADTLWELITHEPFAVSPEDELSIQRFGFDPAELYGLTAPNLGRNPARGWADLTGVDVHRAETTSDACQATLLRHDLCQHKAVRIVDPAGHSNVALGYRQDQEWIARYRDDFAQTREIIQRQVREASQ